MILTNNRGVNLSKNHNALKEVARKILEDMGFKTTEIKEEYWVGGEGLKSFRVDIVGITNNHRVAIECGTTPGEKIAALKMFFDDVIVLPYFTINNSQEANIRIIREQKEKIDRLENDFKTLKENKKTEEEKTQVIRDLIRDAIEIGYRWLNRQAYYTVRGNDQLKVIIKDIREKLMKLETTESNWYP